MLLDGHRLIVLAALVLTAVAASGCGGNERPLRIGVVADCVGAYRELEDAELSAAVLPLIQRGARLRGRRAADGLESGLIAGRPVELVPGCIEAFEFSVLNLEVRRLVEREHVDAVVAAGTGPDEVVLRDIAARYPRIAFLPVVHGPREVTLHRPTPNLFRFVGDHGQGVAGLGDYAYRRLGWRRAAVAFAQWDPGWLPRDAFAAEFCALGGQVVGELGIDLGTAGQAGASALRNVDGVAVFASSISRPAGFLQRLARRLDDPTRMLLVGPGIMDDPGVLGATGNALAGVTGSSYVDPARMRAYLRAYARAFPGVPARVARSELVTGYRDAVEALVQAFERADGSHTRLQAQLARLRIDLLGGRVRLDENRQAVISTSLVRVPDRANATEPPVLVDTIREVDQSVGGLLAAGHAPGFGAVTCRKGRQPPPWTRSGR